MYQRKSCVDANFQLCAEAYRLTVGEVRWRQQSASLHVTLGIRLLRWWRLHLGRCLIRLRSMTLHHSLLPLGGNLEQVISWRRQSSFSVTCLFLGGLHMLFVFLLWKNLSQRAFATTTH